MLKRGLFALVAGFLGLALYLAPVAAWADAGITQAVLGTAISSDYEIASPSTEFAPDTAKIYCAFTTTGIDGDTIVKSAWIAEDVGKVAPANFKIDEATLKLSEDSRGSFSLSKPNNGFPVGKYRVELSIGDKLVKTVTFTVK